MQVLVTHVGRTIAPVAPVVVGVTAVWLAFQERTPVALAFYIAMISSILLFYLPPPRLLILYFSYLMFDGLFKIWSGYHPVVHVGSDLLLIFVVARLLNRAKIESERPYLSARTREHFVLVIKCLFVFWLWVFVQFLNPWGLGLLPSLAGLKLYFVPLLTFLAVGFLLTERELRNLPYAVLALGCLQAVTSLIDWTSGPSLLASLNPRYAAIAGEFLQGFPYRPFGTTSLPGQPSVWIFHSVTAALIVRHGLKSDQEVTGPRRWVWKTILWLYIPLSLMTLLACQVRVAFIRTVLMGIAGFILASRRSALGAVAGVALLLCSYQVFMPKAVKEDIRRYSELKDRIVQAMTRLQTLESTKTWSTARSSDFIMGEFMRRAGATLQGIGLSRVAASSRPWKHLIDEDPYFGAGWSFTDNLYLALLTEVGLGGLVAYLVLVGVLLWQLVIARNYVARLAACHCLVMLLSGYASEGILYQPEAAFFWGYAGLGLRWAGIKEKAVTPEIEPGAELESGTGLIPGGAPC